MRAMFILLLVAAAPLACIAGTPATLQYESLPGIALYANGYLINWDNPRYLETAFYGRDTHPLFTLQEDKHGVYHVTWAIDSDGVAAGVYESRGREEGRIDLYAPDGKILRTLNTGRYIVQRAVFGPDHTLWTVGFNAGNDGREDFYVIRHYARSGQQLGQALLWSQIAGEHNSYTALQAIVGGAWVFASNDRLGFLSLSDSSRSTWVEVSYSGVLLGKYGLGSYLETYYSPQAMTADGSVYAAIWRDKQRVGWAVLDRAAHTWRKVAGYPKGALIGSEGNDLAFSHGDGGWTVVQLVAPESLRLAKPEMPATARAGQ